MACVKDSFRSKGEATKAAHIAHLIAVPYQCHICGEWHLTSVKSQEHHRKGRKHGRIAIARK